jgi:hypothetical protein
LTGLLITGSPYMLDPLEPFSNSAAPNFPLAVEYVETGALENLANGPTAQYDASAAYDEEAIQLFAADGIAMIARYASLGELLTMAYYQPTRPLFDMETEPATKSSHHRSLRPRNNPSPIETPNEPFHPEQSRHVQKFSAATLCLKLLSWSSSALPAAHPQQ